MKPKVPDKRSNKWKCGECGKEFKYNSEKVRHEQSHVAQFQCKICSKKFSFLSAVRRHEKQHERVGDVQCDLCCHKFRDKALLRRHIQYAHKGTFTCKKCASTFHSEMALQTHMKSHKPQSERRYRCSFANCGKSFNFPHHLKHHELTHTDEKQHFCLVCGKGFIQLHHLKVHQKCHEPETWLSCLEPECNKKFSNEYARKRHLVTHKNKLDSGMSSDSSATTVIRTKNSLKVSCVTCGKKMTKGKYEEHFGQCRIKYERFTDELHIITTDESFHNNSDRSLYVFSLEEDETIAKVLKCNSDVPNKITEVLNCNTSTESHSIKDWANNCKLEVSMIKYLGSNHNITANCGNQTNDIPKDLSIDKVGDSIRTCKATIGCCIVTGSSEISSNCICAQMISNDEELDDLVHNGSEVKVNEEKNDGKSLNESTLIAKPKEEHKTVDANGNLNVNKANCDITMCETCECAMTCPINPKNRKEYAPVIELKTDGTVKIKEAFDFDFEVSNNNNVNEKKVIKHPENNIKVNMAIKSSNNINNDENDKKVTILPENNIKVDMTITSSNNCKEVLGSCIVSGDSTINEDCLCAKMSLNSRDQEVDDITPDP